ncbi:hypothetical protein ACWES4_01265 [Streptomyces sp. NPDC004011]
MPGDIRSEHDTWQDLNASGRYSAPPLSLGAAAATPLGAAALGASTELFLAPFPGRRHAPSLLAGAGPRTARDPAPPKSSPLRPTP